MKELFIQIAIALGLFLFIGLFVWDLSSGAKQEWAHNAEQVAECRRLGGFAQTRVDGWLRSCTFPGGR